MGDKKSFESYVSKMGMMGKSKMMSKSKMGKVMGEFGKGKLHIGKSKKIVKNKKQAIAISLAMAGKSKKKS
jgi:hypothetical protein